MGHRTGEIFVSSLVEQLQRSSTDKMNPLHHHLPRLRTLCRRHHVGRLWAFGSVLREDFQPSSDVDLLYELDHANLPGKDSIDHFLAFEAEAKASLGHPVDLVWYPGLRNPYFKAEVDETKALLYEQAPEKVFG